MKNKKIAIFVSKLQGGGAELTAVDLANFIAKKGYAVDLISIKKNKEKNILNKNINLINLNCSRLIFSIPKLFFYMLNNNSSRLFFVSFLNGNNLISIILKIFFKKINLTCTIHNPISSHFKFTTIKDKLIIYMLLFLKNVPNKYVACSNYIKKELVASYGFDKKKIKNIYNPIDFSKIIRKSKKQNYFLKKLKKKNKILISIGRLEYQKNYSSLILKLKKLLISKNIVLIILGTGTEFNYIKALINKNKLKGKVFLLGYKMNPYSYLKYSDLFILNSRWEGLGNVLVESLFLKVPIICNKCPGGINEIFDNKTNKLVFKFQNQKKLESSIINTLYKKKKFSYNEKILKKFNIKNASNEYLKFILN